MVDNRGSIAVCRRIIDDGRVLCCSSSPGGSEVGESTASASRIVTNRAAVEGKGTRVLNPTTKASCAIVRDQGISNSSRRRAAAGDDPTATASCAVVRDRGIGNSHRAGLVDNGTAAECAIIGEGTVSKRRGAEVGNTAAAVGTIVNNRAISQAESACIANATTIGTIAIGNRHRFQGHICTDLKYRSTPPPSTIALPAPAPWSVNDFPIPTFSP